MRNGRVSSDIYVAGYEEEEHNITDLFVGLFHTQIDEQFGRQSLRRYELMTDKP